MSVDLRRFVDIDIKQKELSEFKSTRETIALFTSEVGFAGIVTASTYVTSCANMTNTLAYLKIFFANGGIKANVINGDVSVAALKALPNEQIIVASVSASQNATTLKAIISSYNSDATVYGINEKIVIARTTTIPTSDEDVSLKEKNFIVKYSNVLGAEMTVAAYLSKIDVYEFDTVYDYMFTEEKSITSEDINTAQYDTLMATHLNVDIILASKVRNCGGDCTDGVDATNSYVRIVLHQTLTDRLVELLATKLKNSSGLVRIYSTMAEELNKYVYCGYLTTDKTWTDDDLKTEVNGTAYTIITKGTALLNGYVIKILPYSSLSEEQKKAHSTPYIYVIIADQYGIRKITINGEVY